MDNFFTVSRQVWILFTLIAAGALCRKARLLDDAGVKGIVNVLVCAVTPCLIIDVFQRPFDPATLKALAIAFAIATLNHIALIFVSNLLFRREGPSSRTVLRLASVFSNAGFMGIPLEYALFGDQGVIFGIAYVAVFNLFIWSWGFKISDPSTQGKTTLKAFVNPGTIGLSIGLGLFLLRLTLPGAIGEGVKAIASMNTPLAMIAIGYYLAGAFANGAIKPTKSAIIVSVLRLVVFPLALMAALYPFGRYLPREMTLSLITAASAPVAAMTAMFASMFKRDVSLAAALVSFTTLLSLLTMPLVISLAMSLF